MIFNCANGMKRPVRLCEATRRFAYDSLNHRYGLDTRHTQSVSLDHIADYEAMSPLQRYDAAIDEIAANAPIRICEEERISYFRTCDSPLRTGSLQEQTGLRQHQPSDR